MNNNLFNSRPLVFTMNNKADCGKSRKDQKPVGMPVSPDRPPFCDLRGFIVYAYCVYMVEYMTPNALGDSADIKNKTKNNKRHLRRCVIRRRLHFARCGTHTRSHQRNIETEDFHTSSKIYYISYIKNI